MAKINVVLFSTLLTILCVLSVNYAYGDDTVTKTGQYDEYIIVSVNDASYSVEVSTEIFDCLDSLELIKFHSEQLPVFFLQKNRSDKLEVCDASVKKTIVSFSDANSESVKLIVPANSKVERIQ